jgi:Concanavalin A-like lectin/glucanases superfamily/PEP-CTERM motif
MSRNNQAFVAAAACAVALCASGARAAQVAYRTVVLADNPVAYYELDEAPGATTAADSAPLGGAQNGNYISGLTLGVPSAAPGLGTAVQFGATGPDPAATDDPRIQIPDSPAFDGGTGPFTVEMWFDPNDNFGSRGDLFTYKGTGGDFGVHWSQNAGLTDNITVYHTNGNKVSSGPLSRGAHHLAVVRESTALDGLKLYVDGQLVGMGIDDQTLTITGDPIIGKNTGNNETPFQGVIDEVAVYGAALTQPQIQAHIAASGIPEPGAVGLAGLAALGMLARRRRGS